MQPPSDRTHEKKAGQGTMECEGEKLRDYNSRGVRLSVGWPTDCIPDIGSLHSTPGLR
jgi:hypothetical protein